MLDEDALEDGILELVPVGGDTSDELNANVSLRHTFNLGNGGALTPMLGFYWVSQDPEIQSVSGGVTTFEYCGRQGDYAKWRARLTYEPPSRDYEISLFGNNVTDELIYDHCTDRRGVYNYRHERPASWGVEFSARWGA